MHARKRSVLSLAALGLVFFTHLCVREGRAKDVARRSTGWVDSFLWGYCRFRQRLVEAHGEIAFAVAEERAELEEERRIREEEHDVEFGVDFARLRIEI